MPTTLSSSFSSSASPLIEALDSEDFDAVGWINKQFPNERSLTSVPSVLQNLDQMLVEVDTQIASAIRSQARVGFTGRNDLEEAKKSMGKNYLDLWFGQ